jgi:glycosyltransferase involved in cell wall biosynthesis
MNPTGERLSVIVPTLNRRITVSRLVASIYAQDYRPLDLVVVDGGSKDGTQEALTDFVVSHSSTEFLVKILRESDYGLLRGPGNARNIGLLSCEGTNVLFLDADFVLDDPHFLTLVYESLKSHPWVGVRVRPMDESWLEFHCSLDDFRPDLGSNVHMYCAFRRDLLLNVMYDPSLGMREDWDLGKRLERDYNAHPYFAEAWCLRHFPHTLEEWRDQAVWHGMTLPRFVKKWPLAGLSVFIQRTGAGLSAVLAILSLPMSADLTILFAALFLSRVLVAYLASPRKRRFRVGYLLLRESYWSLNLLAGFMIGTVLELGQFLGIRRHEGAQEKNTK